MVCAFFIQYKVKNHHPLYFMFFIQVINICFFNVPMS